jgi:hypothetical protein
MGKRWNKLKSPGGRESALVHYEGIIHETN